jgi:hypothetical protein
MTKSYKTTRNDPVRQGSFRLLTSEAKAHASDGGTCDRIVDAVHWKAHATVELSALEGPCDASADISAVAV